ncbi:MAG: VanZ family protein, partial [Gammaproteobacteria bacterium]
MNSARQQTTEQFSPGWLAVTFLFWLGNVVLHLEFSNWLVRPYSTPLGEFIPRDLSVHAAVISALLTAALLWKRIARGEARLAHGITWVLWSITAASAFLLLMTTPIEAIHYLQYGILAFLLASALDPDKQQWPLTTLLFITVGLGIIDELNQYFLLTPGNSTYIDFNDFVLNMLGEQAGLFAYYAGLHHDRPPRPGTDSTHAAQITLAAYML